LNSIVVYASEELKIKYQTGDGRYWSGYRYGLQAFWSDFVLPEKEKWKNKLIEE